MAKSNAAAVVALVLAGLIQINCAEEMVGAPCVPETQGDFSATLKDDNIAWSIETRSVQCETRTCLTMTQDNPFNLSKPCEDDASVDNCWEGENGPTQIKYSFCSCRCADSMGNTYSDNPDKFDYLCECPGGGNKRCVPVLSGIEGAPEMIMGSYCVPSCIDPRKPSLEKICAPRDEDGDGNIESRMCVPASDSEKPWQWVCEEVDLSAAE